MDIHADELAGILPLGAYSAGLRMSPAEFDTLQSGDVDEAYRYELVEGVLVVNPIESDANADPNDLLGQLLRNYRDQHPAGKCLDKTLPERYIHLPNSRRRPDRVLWIGLGRRPNTRTDVPTIAIEFVSSGRRSWMRDYIEKRDEYLAVGVKEYWVIDRFRREMSVYTPGPEEPREKLVQEHDVFETPLLPGFQLPLANILSAADEWESP